MENTSLRKVVDVEMPTPLGVYQLHLFAEKIEEACKEKFKSNIVSVLFQGSQMRGDGSPYESDYDFILIFHEEIF